MPADVNLDIDINKKGDGDKEAAAGLELVAKSADHTKDQLAQLDRKLLETRAAMVAAGKTFTETGDISPLKSLIKDERQLQTVMTAISRGAESIKKDMADVGTETDKTSKKMVNLAGDITKAKAALAEMGNEFRKTGKIDLDSFKTLTNTLRELERAKAAIGKLAPGDKKDNGGLLNFALDEAFAQGVRKAGDAGKSIANSIGDGISKNPIISTAIIAGVVVGVPVLTGVVGSAIAAGVSFGFGGGIIATGIALAAKDTRVGAAWGSLWETSMTNLESASVVFVDPLIRGASTVSAAWMNTTSRIGTAFHALAPLVDDLSVGASGFLSNLGPAIDALTRAAGPFIADFAAWLPELGAAISDFAASIEKAGPGARAFFNDMLSLVTGVVGALGWLAEAGSQAYLYLGGVGDLASGKVTTGLTEMYLAMTGNTKAFTDAQSAVEGTSDKLARLAVGSYHAADGSLVLATNYGGLMKALGQTAATADTVAGAMSDKFLNGMMSLDQASLNFAQSQTRVSDAIKADGRELDIHTVKGQGNRQAILGAVQANIGAYDANIRAGMSAADAAKAYDVNTTALEGQLRKAGFTQQAIDGLIGKYRNVPKNVNTDIATKGLTEALNGLEDVIRKANGLNGRVVTMTVEELHRTIYDNSTPPSQVMTGKALGGIVAAAQGMIASSPTILFGERETGLEAYIPRDGIPDARGLALADTAARWHGGMVVPRGGYGGAPSGGGGTTVINNISVSVTAGVGDANAIADEVGRHVQKFVLSKGGNAQEALGRRGS